METIKDLWNGNICPAEHFGAGNYKMKKLEHFLFESEEEILEELSDDLKGSFRNYIDQFNEYNNLSNETAFAEGFSYGVKLMAESISI